MLPTETGKNASVQVAFAKMAQERDLVYWQFYQGSLLPDFDKFC